MGELWSWRKSWSWRKTWWAKSRRENSPGNTFSKPRTPLYHRIHKFKSSVVKSIVGSSVNSRFIRSEPDLKELVTWPSTPPQIAVAVVRHLSSSNFALLWMWSVIDKDNSLRKLCRKETACQLIWCCRVCKMAGCTGGLLFTYLVLLSGGELRWKLGQDGDRTFVPLANSGANWTIVRVSAEEKKLAWCCKIFAWGALYQADINTNVHVLVIFA